MPESRKAVLVKASKHVEAELLAAPEDGDFEGSQFKVVRSFADWQSDELDDLDCTQIDVVAVAHEDEDLDDRESVGYVCSIDVGVRRKFSSRDASQNGRTRIEEIESLILLVEEIHEFFCKRQLEDEEVWRGAKIRVSYSPDHLRDQNMFLGIVRINLFASQDL